MAACLLSNELVGVLKAMAIVRLVGYQIVCRLLLCFLDRVQGAGGHNMRDPGHNSTPEYVQTERAQVSLDAVIPPSLPALDL